jgi:hypothetical protein
VLRFIEAIRSNDRERIDAFIPEKGLLFELQYNDDKPEKNRFRRGEVTSFGRLETDEALDAISCKPFDAAGVAECRTDRSTITVKRRKTDTVITTIFQLVYEGC